MREAVKIRVEGGFFKGRKFENSKESLHLSLETTLQTRDNLIVCD
jgi:hypothetical protein